MGLRAPLRVIGPKLFVEFVAAAGCIDDDDLTLLAGQVQEGVWDLRRQIGEAAFVAIEDLIANADLEATLEHLDGLLLAMVHVQRRAAMWGHFNDEIVKGAVRVLARVLENKVPARTVAASLRLPSEPCSCW